eukprot:5404698-Prymnesium_polylepis.1
MDLLGEVGSADVATKASGGLVGVEVRVAKKAVNGHQGPRFAAANPLWCHSRGKAGKEGGSDGKRGSRSVGGGASGALVGTKGGCPGNDL